MKFAFITLLDHIPGPSVHLFNSVYQKNSKNLNSLYSLSEYHFMPNDYVEENQPIFNQSYHDMYLSIIITYFRHLKAKIHWKVGQIDSDRDRFR